MAAANPRLSRLRATSRLEFIETAGGLCRRLGLPRSVGQIYGLLFFSPKPLALDDIAEALGISKASVSTGTRQLAAWGAIRQVWMPGDRRDFFEVVPELGTLLAAAYRDLIKPRLVSSQRRFDRLLAALDQDRAEGVLSAEEFETCTQRLKSLHRLQKKLQTVLPFIDKLL